MPVRLSVRELSVVYHPPGGSLLPVLGPISFSIEPGSFVCILGPSGGGKSTLIRILAGLQQPTSGMAYLNDEPIKEPSTDVGLMFQDANLMPWRTVSDNIALPLELMGIPSKQREQAVSELLPTLGLEEFPFAYPGQLSGGMAQRVALGRVLVQKPGALLLDEPFGALDALTREQISLDLMRFWVERKQTVVMVTHSINEAVLLADRILVLSRRPGRIAADIPVLLERPRSLEGEYTAAFGEIAGTVRAAINQA
jgi:NitT/TauT family transport system ATP-binding protein